MNFKITFASQDESFPLELGEVTARIVPADPDLQDKTVTPTEQAQTVTCDPPHDGLGTVTVNRIPPEYVIPDLQSKSVTPMETAQTVTADAGKTGLSAVEVGAIPPEYVIPSGTVQITANGQHDVSGKAVAAVNVQPVLQSKSVTPTRASQTVTPDSGKDGLSAVEVGGIPSEYVIPEGTKQIAANGTHDVSGYASAQVAVPGPSGSVSITANGTHDVTDYASAVVDVPGIVPTGQIEITENGTVDVAAFASALVNVAGGGGASNVVTGTFKGTSKGVLTISLGYTGSGYPVSIIIFPEEGYMKANGVFGPILHQNAMDYSVAIKTRNITPTYSGDVSSTSGDQMILLSGYKSSTTTATSVTHKQSPNARPLAATEPNGDTYSNVIRIPNAKTLKAYIVTDDDIEFGFLAGIPYRYTVTYSE